MLLLTGGGKLGTIGFLVFASCRDVSKMLLLLLFVGTMCGNEPEFISAGRLPRVLTEVIALWESFSFFCVLAPMEMCHPFPDKTGNTSKYIL